jgi:adenylate cyclase
VIIAIAWRLFASHSLVVPLAVPILVQVPLALFLGVLARYRDIRKQTPVEVDPDAAQELFVGVCLTTDVESYTALAKRLSPSELGDLLAEYHALLRAIVTRHHGLVWGRGGDSALAVWKASRRASWPMRLASRAASEPGRADDEGRLNACRAALEIQDAIDAFNRRHGETAQMRTRIGLDAGILGLGPVAGELQAVGTPANVATRIQHLNKRLGTRLLASNAVVEELDALIVRPLGRFALDGVAEPVAIVEIRGLRTAEDDADRRLREDFAAGLALFESGNWPAAIAHFRRLEREWPGDGPLRYYRGMAERHGRAELPAGESVPLPGSDRDDAPG